MDLILYYKELEALYKRCAEELGRPIDKITCIEFYAWIQNIKIGELK
jgi:hypothetical protein